VQSAKSTAVIEIEIENPSEKKPMDFFWSIRAYCGCSTKVVLAESSPSKPPEHFRQPKDLGNTRPTPRMGHQNLQPRAKRSVALGYLENTVLRPERLKGQYV
jgi:hypothetical protein